MESCNICDAILPAHNLMCPRAKNNRPTVGEPFTWGEQTIIPSYVRESESPRADGGCVTANLTRDGEIDAAGWYVEFTYTTGGQHRAYIPFDTTNEEN
jgi:hypothetical protein